MKYIVTRLKCGTANVAHVFLDGESQDTAILEFDRRNPDIREYAVDGYDSLVNLLLMSAEFAGVEDVLLCIGGKGFVRLDRGRQFPGEPQLNMTLRGGTGNVEWQLASRAPAPTPGETVPMPGPPKVTIEDLRGNARQSCRQVAHVKVTQDAQSPGGRLENLLEPEPRDGERRSAIARIAERFVALGGTLGELADLMDHVKGA